MKSGKLLVGFFTLLIVAAFASAGVLLLVQNGIISVAVDSGQSVLNAEFIPYGREGSLVIEDFSFCEAVTDRYECLPRSEFSLGERVSFVYAVVTNSHQGDIKLRSDYRLLGPAGEVLLDVHDVTNFDVELSRSRAEERLVLSDYFTLGEDDPLGEYTIELLVENAVLGKSSKVAKKVMVR